jgi:hypothetical protein
MDSLFDLACFAVKKLLRTATPQLLLRLRYLPEDVLIRIGRMPETRPYLRWLRKQDDFGHQLVYLHYYALLNNKKWYANEGYESIKLPLIIETPPVFYYRCVQCGFESRETYVSLYPKEGYKQRKLTEQYLIRGTHEIYIY